MASRVEKLRGSCFCDCNGEKKAAVPAVAEKKPIQIEYEPEEKAHAKAALSGESEGENKCPCVCHGTYNDGIFEQEEQKKLKTK